MIGREEALKILEEKVQNKQSLPLSNNGKNIIKHMLATESMMKALARELSKRHPELVSGSNGTLKQVQGDNIDEEEWAMAGLLHDGDYSEGVPDERQGIQISEWIKDRGLEIPETVKYAMASHNFSNTGVEPKSKMDWALFCGDSLTGLITACALILPDKKLADVKLESVLKKFKNPNFAGGTRREDIQLCEEKLGLSLEEFVTIALKAMQEIAPELGL